MSAKFSAAERETLPEIDVRSSTDPLIGKIVRGYRITDLIGVGGVGSVYRGQHTVLPTEVAIKVVRSDVAASSQVLARFEQESRLPSIIGSPHIPRCFDFGRLGDGRPFAILELVHGEPLDRYLARTGPLSIANTLSLLRDLAAVVRDVHSAGVVHRDLKPGNVLVVDGEHGRSLKLVDFGLAKVMLPDSVRRITRAGVFVGTPLYSSPEQLVLDDISPRSDIYSLGVIAFEMLTGRLPFEGDIKSVYDAKQRFEAPRTTTLRPDVPRELDALVGRLLARDKNARPASIDDVLDQLYAVSEDEITQWEAKPRRREPTAPTVARRVLPWVLAVAVAMAAGVLAAML